MYLPKLPQRPDLNYYLELIETKVKLDNPQVIISTYKDNSQTPVTHTAIQFIIENNSKIKNHQIDELEKRLNNTDPNIQPFLIPYLQPTSYQIQKNLKINTSNASSSYYLHRNLTNNSLRFEIQFEAILNSQSVNQKLNRYFYNNQQTSQEKVPTKLDKLRKNPLKNLLYIHDQTVF